MSGETEKDISGWTTDTLHLFIQHQINDLRTMLNERYVTQTKAIASEFASQRVAMQTNLVAAERAVATALLNVEKAVGKAEIAADKRFDSMNEFREQLNNQAGTFVTRTESDAAINRNTERIQALEGAVKSLATRSEVQVITDRYTERFQDLADRVTKTEGATMGMRQGWTVLVAVATLATGIYLAFHH